MTPTSPPTAAPEPSGTLLAGPRPAEPRTPTLATDPDGYIWDPETGEVYGVADPETGRVAWLVDADRLDALGIDLADPGDIDRREPFAIRADDAADWVLKLITAEEAELKALESRKAALIANLEGMAVRHRNRLKSLHWRFDGELERFAAEELARRGGKAKSLALPHGRLGFRSSKGSAEITEPAKALDFVEEWAPDKVRKSAGIEAVRVAIQMAKAMTDEEPDVSGFFRETGPRENFAITTGLKD